MKHIQYVDFIDAVDVVGSGCFQQVKNSMIQVTLCINTFQKKN